MYHLLTGFFSVVADDSGVKDGIQKLGRSLSRPPTMLETLDAAAACWSTTKTANCRYD